ncbi:hypothetical protein, variant 1 [Verruconis gallopava]|uniref:Uncharacterized protein n=1 Tax=Verruconis gallopava TaxID=253628 RepID=A0A0D2AKB5_9PEZI|nr:hypothetical protein, variant 1 [Verruconis gallopava]KIW07293.1 hypothetical protein, variant 1 [Verruconis gallopava]
MTEMRTPPFIFQANRIRQNENLRSIRDTHGRWQPPRALHGSQIRLGQSTDRFFYFNGERTAEIGELPQNAELYRTVSMYYSLGQFYMVPYDCTLYTVGSGRANDEEGDSSEEEDAEGEDEGELEINSIDWSLLRFHWLSQGYLSEAWFNGSYPRLNTQRPDQHWVNRLLPSPYRAEFSRRTQDQLYGGLNGDLAILIALLAFSAYDGAVADVFEYSVRAVHGENGGWKIHNRHEEEGCMFLIIEQLLFRF